MWPAEPLFQAAVENWPLESSKRFDGENVKLLLLVAFI